MLPKSVFYFSLIMILYLISCSSTKEVNNSNQELMNQVLDSDSPLENSDETIYLSVDKEPELEGGIKAFYYKMKYPKEAIKEKIEGRVLVQFIVNSNGKVENAEVIQGIGGGCDEEALSLVKTAKFKPGIKDGKPVNVQMVLPIEFRLGKN